MVWSIALALLTPALAQQEASDRSQFSLIREMRLDSLDTGEELLLVMGRDEKLKPPKKSPLNGWDFEYLVSGYARDSLDENFNIRFRVFNQFRRNTNDPTDYVVRMMLRLWDFNRQRLKRDHSDFIHLRSVDVYLAFGGEPGAEQTFMEDPFEVDKDGRPTRVNNIYVYAITTIDQPLEFARELAHEYGHATLPPIGGYSEPEEWVTGDIGERVYLMWLLQGMKAGKLGPADVMRTQLDDMQAYYDKVVKPDLIRVGTKGPNLDMLKLRDKTGFDELMGLTSYVAAALPHEMFGRAIVLAESKDAESFYKAVTEAAQEKEDWEVTVPEGLSGQAIWVPLSKGGVTGANVLRREGDWVKIQPTAAKVTIHNDPAGQKT